MDPQTIIAKRIAQELADGMLVNLGIGIPTLVANHVPPGMRIFFQSENGLIGTGPIPQEGLAQARLTDAGGKPVSAIPGACTFDSATSIFTPLSASISSTRRRSSRTRRFVEPRGRPRRRGVTPFIGRAPAS